MAETTAEQATDPQPDEASDRKSWEELRAAAYLGQLWPAGFKLVDQLHDRHPEWRGEW